jgi:hypothetical protein
MSELALISRELLAFQATTLKLKIDLKETSKPFSDRCQMAACNDIEAIFEWLDEYKHKKNTYAAYKREALRFLLWCMYERGKDLSSLKKEDMQDYFKFLQNPPKNWCKVGKNDIKTKTWKPFKFIGLIYCDSNFKIPL